MLTLLAAAYLLVSWPDTISDWATSGATISSRHHSSLSPCCSSVSSAGGDATFPPPVDEGEQSRWQWPGFVVLMFALYVLVIGSGLFADDFVLLQAVREGRWTVWTEFFRPVLFLVWRCRRPSWRDRSPAAVLNLVLHALNASMVALLGHRLGLRNWPRSPQVRCFYVPGGGGSRRVAGRDSGCADDELRPGIAAGPDRAAPDNWKGRPLRRPRRRRLSHERDRRHRDGFALLTCGVMRASRERWMVAVVTLVAVIATLAVRFALVPLSGSAIPGVGV